MANTYDWQITGMRVLKTFTPAEDTFTDVVDHLTYQVTVTDEAGVSYPYYSGVEINIGDVNTTNFTEYANITEATALEWVQSSLPEDFYTSLDVWHSRLKEQDNKENKTLPWA